MKQLDPLSIRRLRHLSRIAAITAEDVEILRQIEVNRPVVPVHVIGGALAVRQVIASEVKVFTLNRLPVVPDRLAIEPPELMAGDLVRDAALMNQSVMR